MKYIINIINTIKKMLPRQIKPPLGRWTIENCHKKINYKIDLSNEDHCGSCGQYSLEQIKIKNKKDKK